MDTTEKIAQARIDHPDWTMAKIGEEHGVSREYVRQVLAKAGLPTRVDPRITRVSAGNPRVVSRFGGGAKVTQHTAGCVSELYVAADLLSRGMSVYRSLHPHAKCDLITLNNGKPLKIEVRGGKRDASGRVQCADPYQRDYDIFAIVLPDGEIIYKPPIEEWPAK